MTADSQLLVKENVTPVKISKAVIPDSVEEVSAIRSITPSKQPLTLQFDNESKESNDNITPVTNENEKEKERTNSKLKQVQFLPKNASQFRYDESSTSDSYSEESSELAEDDDNTINSDTTSTLKKKDADKTVLPQFTRYQLMILLDKNDPFNMLDEINEDELKSPAQRVRDILISMVTQVQLFDPEAKVISWKTTPNYTYLDKDNFPEEIAGIAKYFQGYKSNIKADKRVYLSRMVAPQK